MSTASASRALHEVRAARSMPRGSTDLLVYFCVTAIFWCLETIVHNKNADKSPGLCSNSHFSTGDDGMSADLKFWTCFAPLLGGRNGGESSVAWTLASHRFSWNLLLWEVNCYRLRVASNSNSLGYLCSSIGVCLLHLLGYFRGNA